MDGGTRNESTPAIPQAERHCRAESLEATEMERRGCPIKCDLPILCGSRRQSGTFSDREYLETTIQ
jgi:hypothetical protein